MIESPELFHHCERLLIASAIGIVLGLAIARRTDPTGSFGWMTAAWSAINALIAVPGYLTPKIDPGSFLPFLAFNLGLNIAYLGVGCTLFLLGNPRTKGAGLAVAVQGVLLLVLDGILYFQVHLKVTAGE